jgi:hypothetical protein
MYKMDESKAVYDMSNEHVADGNFDVLKAYLEEHPEVKVDLFRDGDGWTALHSTSSYRSPKCTELLLDHNADINAHTLSDGDIPLTLACWYVVNEDTALLLIERGADIHLKDVDDLDALYCCVLRNIRSIAFTLLCCGSDVKEVKINVYLTQAKVDVCIAEYKDTHSFIEAYHKSLMRTLSTDVPVDTRIGLRECGIYHEPLERVLEYCGLSMHKDQVVNTSIDGQGANGVKRVLIPGQARITKYWYDISKQ